MLVTRRLFLLPLDRAMMTTRIEADDFVLTCETPDGSREVHFGPEWPGEPLVIFPALAAGLGDADAVEGSFAVVHRESGEAVGQVGTKGGGPDAFGVVEIGYGLSPAVRGQGLATEAIGALIEHLRTASGITAVTAETAVSNVASQRVLEKNGFERTGTSWSRDDGDLITWARR